MSKGTVSTYPERERAVLVGVDVRGRHSLWSLSDSLAELGQLAATANAKVVGQVTQRLERQSHTYLGRGKLIELQNLQEILGYTVVIADDELTPSQQRGLERALQVKVIDRSALILDIFARHAKTREGRLQVELAQHEYLLPRLVGQWSHLERLGGGIGTRGPGETQLETDRRLIRRRIARLRGDLETVHRQRSRYRTRRQHVGSTIVSMVGYTNAGKSTLFNALSHARVGVGDRLFETLDPVTRRIALPNGRLILLTDTVGFIQKLPHTVIDAFRATLEELFEADLLLHVVDVGHPNFSEQTKVVDETLRGLGLAEKPRLLVLNKLDRIVEGHTLNEDLAHLRYRTSGHERNEEPMETVPGMDRSSVSRGDRSHPVYRIEDLDTGTEPVAVSARRGWGLELLQTRVMAELQGLSEELHPRRPSTYMVG